jgi:hypothetical protein
MDMKFYDILAGETSRRFEDETQRGIQQAMFGA